MEIDIQTIRGEAGTATGFMMIDDHKTINVLRKPDNSISIFVDSFEPKEKGIFTGGTIAHFELTEEQSENFRTWIREKAGLT